MPDGVVRVEMLTLKLRSLFALAALTASVANAQTGLKQIGFLAR
jgi:hypothetical protein